MCRGLSSLRQTPSMLEFEIEMEPDWVRPLDPTCLWRDLPRLDSLRHGQSGTANPSMFEFEIENGGPTWFAQLIPRAYGEICRRLDSLRHGQSGTANPSEVEFEMPN